MLFTHPLGNVHTQQLGSPGFHLAQTRRSELALQSPAARTKATSSRSHPSSPQKKKGKEKKKKAVVFHVTHFPDLDAHLPDLDSRQLMLFFHVAWRCEESCWEPFANVPHLQPLSLDSHPTPKPHTHTHTHTQESPHKPLFLLFLVVRLVFCWRVLCLQSSIYPQPAKKKQR